METKLNPIFVAKEGEYGLTRTQAQHLCALADHLKAQSESTLKATRFYGETISLIGSQSKNVAKTGMTNLNALKEALETVSRMNAFISWFREADKNLDDELNFWKNLGVSSYTKEFGIEQQTHPERPIKEKVFITTDAINALDVKNRELYLALEAKAAAFGKYIQEGNTLDKARRDFYDKLLNPSDVDENGRDTIVHEFVPSVEPEVLDEFYNSMQREYRTTEQQLNHMKSKLRNWVDAKNLEASREYEKQLREYTRKTKLVDAEYDELVSKANSWKDENIARVSSLRIRVPEALASTEKMLRELGK